MTTTIDAAAAAAVQAAARELHLPAIREHAQRIAAQAQRAKATYLAFLADTLSIEVDERAERRRSRRIHEAHFPRIKRINEFDFDAAPPINPATIATLAAGGYLDNGEPVVLLGNSGTGKTHLLIGLGVAACEQGRRVRYTTCAQLVNELVVHGGGGCRSAADRQDEGLSDGGSVPGEWRSQGHAGDPTRKVLAGACMGAVGAGQHGPGCLTGRAGGPRSAPAAVDRSADCRAASRPGEVGSGASADHVGRRACAPAAVARWASQRFG